MKTLALLLALSALSCASNAGFEANDVETCEPGSDIEIQAGAAETSVLPDGRVMALVEIANNSDRPFTVANIRVDPQPSAERSRFDVQGGSRRVDREIADGEDALFEIPMTVRLRDTLDATPQRGVTVAVHVAVTVQLEGGDSARCRFLLPVRF